MPTRTLATALSALAALAALAVAAPNATAAGPAFCSADSSFDPVAASDVIVAGRISSYMVLDPLQTGPYVPVELRIDVERVLKGTYSRETPIIDAASLNVLPASPGAPMRRIWAGAAGACGALDDDPTGWYAVLGLQRVDGGALRTNRLTTFYLAPEPYAAAMFDRLQTRYGLPATGTGDGGRDSQHVVLLFAAAAAAAGATVVCAAMTVTLHRRYTRSR